MLFSNFIACEDYNMTHHFIFNAKTQNMEILLSHPVYDKSHSQVIFSSWQIVLKRSNHFETSLLPIIAKVPCHSICYYNLWNCVAQKQSLITSKAKGNRINFKLTAKSSLIANKSHNTCHDLARSPRSVGAPKIVPKNWKTINTHCLKLLLFVSNSVPSVFFCSAILGLKWWNFD